MSGKGCAHFQGSYCLLNLSASRRNTGGSISLFEIGAIATILVSQLRVL